jgi:hypothetical protein
MTRNPARKEIPEMKLLRILVPVVLSILATALALLATRFFDRIEIEREFGPLTGEIDPLPGI